MTRERFKHFHRVARVGGLGTLATALDNRRFQWFLTQVYDLRFPRIRDLRIDTRSFDSLRHGGTTHAELVAFHHSRGWFHCAHKSLLRLWTERKAMK